MNEFEKTIRETLSETDKFDAASAETLRKEIIQMYEEKLKKYRWLTWACLIVFAIISIAAIEVLIFASSPKILIISAVVLLGVGQLEVLMKLWYWIMNNKLNVLKEIKQLQLQIAELKGKEPPAGN